MKLTNTGSVRPNVELKQNAQAEQSAKARAMAKLTGQGQPQQAEQPIVQNQSQIQAEEMGAIMQVPKPQIAESQESVQQVDVSSKNEQADANKASEVPAEDKRLSERFAKLARQEKQLRIERQRREADLKAREEKIKQQEAAIQSQPKFDPSQYISKQQLKQNTLQALAEAEVSYDELVQQQLGLGQQDPRVAAQLGKLEGEIKRLNDALDAQRRGQEEQQAAGYQAALKQIRSDANDLVKSDPSFEMIRATRSVSDVVELIERTFKEEGRILSVEDAAQEVENYLVNETVRLAKAKKIQASLQPKQAAPAKAEDQKTAEQQKQPMKTLTNANSSTRKLSNRERAMLAFKNELK